MLAGGPSPPRSPGDRPAGPSGSWSDTAAFTCPVLAYLFSLFTSVELTGPLSEWEENRWRGERSGQLGPKSRGAQPGSTGLEAKGWVEILWTVSFSVKIHT